MKKLFYVLCMSVTLLLVPSSCTDCDCMDEIKDAYRQEVEMKTEMIKNYLVKYPQAGVQACVNGERVCSELRVTNVRIEDDYVYWGENGMFRVVDWLSVKIEGGWLVFYFKG